MKNIFLSIIIFMFYQNIFAQSDHYTTINTPTDVIVEAIYLVEASVDQIATWEEQAANWISSHSSNAVRIAPASRTYNCHNFAWHNSDGGNKRWVQKMDRYSGENLSKYWSGSASTYQQTISFEATKIFYPNGDHSAITTDQAGVFISKWGYWGVYRHSPSDCPYTSSNLQYYYIPITGDDLICSSKTYSTLNISIASYNWSGNKVSVTNNGSSATATKTLNGSGWINAHISSPYSGTTVLAKKTFWVGKPGIPSTNPSGYPVLDVPLDAYLNIALTSMPGASTSMPKTWWSTGSLELDHTTPNGCTFHAYKTGIGNFYVTTQNACGTSPAGGGTVDVYSGGGGPPGGGPPIPLKLSVTPNPSDDYFEAFLENLSEEEYLNNEKLHIKLLNSRSIPIYNGVTQQKKFQINTSSFSEGLYYLQVQYKNQKYTATIIISH